MKKSDGQDIDWMDLEGAREVAEELKKVIPDDVILYPRLGMTEIERLEYYIFRLQERLQRLKATISE